MVNILNLKDILKSIFTLIIMFKADGLTLDDVNDATVSNDGSFKLDATDPLKSIQSFCPSSFCSTNGTRSHLLNGYENSCCIPCDCSRSCHSVGREFEADLTHESTDTFEEKCIQTSVAGPKALNADPDEFLLIQSCPFTYQIEGKDKETAGKCLQPNKRKLAEVMPVYSKTTGKSYRNIYCANCNRDFDVTAWNGQIICPSFKRFYFKVTSSTNRRLHHSYLSKDYSLGDHCVLKWEPAPGTVSLCIDKEKVVSSCNPLKHNFENLQEICSKLYAPVKLEATVYKNVFCLACNANIDFCTDVDYRGQQFLVEIKSEFATKLVYDTYVKEDTVGSCEGGMVYDRLLGQCILKACPMAQVRVADTCVPALGDISGIAIDYRLKLIYRNEGFILPSAEKIRDDVLHLIIHENDKNRNLCDASILGVASHKDNVEVVFKLTKILTQPISLYDDFRMFENKLNARASKGNVSFKVLMYDSPLRPIFPDIVSLAKYDYAEKALGCSDSIAMTSINFCDLVILNEAACEDGTVNLSNGITFAPGEYIIRLTTTELVYVCYDLYVSKMMKAGGRFVSSSTSGCCALLMSVLFALILTTMI